MTHNLLKGKRGIIFGALNEESIAWKVAVKAAEEGATIALSNTAMALRMGTLDKLAEQINAPIIAADATSVEDLEKVFTEAQEKLGGKIDFVLHSVAMSPNVRKHRTYDDLDYNFLNKTLDISAISFHKMLQVASQLVSAVDSIYALNDSARIIVAGDFNDYSDSPALRYLYQHHLVNISVGVKGSHGAKATYRWHGDWRSLDQILFSPSLSRLKMSCQIGDLPFLLEDDEKYGGKKPFRTYLGPRYLGGYSDHLPLVAKFKIEGGYE